MTQPQSQSNFASTFLIDHLRPEVDDILAAICWVMDIGWPWVSDESLISHFTESSVKIAAVAKRLGVPIDPNDLIWKIAVRVKGRNGMLS